MALRALRPCGMRGCATLTRERYCEAHGSTGWGASQRAKGNVTERGYGHAWRKLRDIVLRRDSHLCQACLIEGRAIAATDVDHVLAKAKGGTDDIGNLSSLCRSHHLSKTASERK